MRSIVACELLHAPFPDRTRILPYGVSDGRGIRAYTPIIGKILALFGFALSISIKNSKETWYVNIKSLNHWRDREIKAHQLQGEFDFLKPDVLDQFIRTVRKAIEEKEAPFLKIAESIENLKELSSLEALDLAYSSIAEGIASYRTAINLVKNIASIDHASFQKRLDPLKIALDEEFNKNAAPYLVDKIRSMELLFKSIEELLADIDKLPQKKSPLFEKLIECLQAVQCDLLKEIDLYCLERAAKPLGLVNAKQIVSLQEVSQKMRLLNRRINQSIETLMGLV